MQPTKPPREFWIWWGNDVDVFEEKPSEKDLKIMEDSTCGYSHAIEYSAYEQAMQQLALANDFKQVHSDLTKSAFDLSKKLEAENAKLREQLYKVKSSMSYIFRGLKHATNDHSNCCCFTCEGLEIAGKIIEKLSAEQPGAKDE